jgi:hypothetical protein
MGILSSFFGHKWRLDVCYNDEPLYSMQHDSPHRIIGHIMSRYIDGETPVTPWSLWLVFKNGKASFKIEPKHLTKDGKEDVGLFNQAVSSIDSSITSGNYEPVCVNVKTKKVMQISHIPDSMEDLTAYTMNRLQNLGKKQPPRDETFYDILDKVFQT